MWITIAGLLTTLGIANVSFSDAARSFHCEVELLRDGVYTQVIAFVEAPDGIEGRYTITTINVVEQNRSLSRQSGDFTIPEGGGRQIVARSIMGGRSNIQIDVDFSVQTDGNPIECVKSKR